MTKVLVMRPLPIYRRALSPTTPDAPRRVLSYSIACKIIQGELMMIKNFRMVIDLTVNISEMITPELIEQLKTENIEYNYLTLDREKLDKL